MSPPNHLPLELLETFVAIADHDGDAAAAGRQLEISQPTVSKRLAALRRLTADGSRPPWLLLKGKRWLLTSEGERMRGVAADLIRQYRRVEAFAAGGSLPSRPEVSLACGQQAAAGFVKGAVERFLREQPESRIRLSTARAKARIEGVAAGRFDLAVVAEAPAIIRRTARTELFVETLFEDRLVLAANPRPKATWARQWGELPTDRPVAARDLVGLPFILPEPDATRRQQFDQWIYRSTGQPVDVVIETGGWQTILDFASAGLGVALASQSAIDWLDGTRPEELTMRMLAVQDLHPRIVHLIARKIHGQNEPDLEGTAAGLRSALKRMAEVTTIPR